MYLFTVLNTSTIVKGKNEKEDQRKKKRKKRD